MQVRTCVIAVNYKGAGDTAQCVALLKRSTALVTIVVIDNTPNDPELEVALSPYSDVILIRAPENLGFGGGNNLGINWALAQTDCEFIFILNNDATVEPDTIAKLEFALDDHPEAGIVTPRIVFMDKPDMLWYGGGEVSWLRGGGKTPGVFGACDAPLAMQAREVSFASGCAILLRRKLMQQLDGFDERFFMYEEDMELCLRTQKLGWKIRYEPSALVLHAVQSSSRGEQGYVAPLSPLNKNLPFYAYHFVRNRLINMRLHANGYHRLVFVVGFSLWIIKYSGVFLLHQRWDGLTAMFKGWRSYRLCFARDCDKVGN
jgi:GT2 family glycosyltransferase